MSSRLLTITAGLFGNALEWYDFILYANFATIIAQLFFPSTDPSTSLILTFIVFATGFAVRPIGALIFGYIGDHFGRRVALIISICLISIPTIVIGLLPTFAEIGVLAPILLASLRIFQGIAVSGELNSAATFLIEHAPDNRRGLMGSLVQASAFLGILLGAITSYLMSLLLSVDELNRWGWRLPFWIGGTIGIIGLMIRLRVKESPKFLQEIPTEKKAPLKNLYFHFGKEIFIAILIVSIMAVGNYLSIAFVVTFLIKFGGYSLKDATLINVISMSIMLFTFPLMGILSDNFGRKPIFKIGIYSLIIVAFPVFWLLSSPHFAYALLGDIILCLALVPIPAIIPIILAEIFPTQVRNSGTAISYNLCLALLGGTTPLIALKLIDITQSKLAPAMYLVAIAIVSLISLSFIRESYDKPLL